MASRPIFDKILIANRGEIACRIINTCRRLGIKTVAVYSTADEQAKHVRMADEAVCIGPPASRESYLVIDKIIDAALRTRANAVHPGYGFLSENAEFSAALARNNIVFIGPDAHSIDAMGDKIHSKKLAKAAGVSVIPGFLGEVTSHEDLLQFASEVGYPVMVKASGGGGGKGMRVAYNAEECVEYYDMCKEEAKAAFNNDTMLVEKFIEDPRHIEIQIIADRHGNVVYLPERECSIQRRNQKVLEEAPSTLLDAKTRRAMGEQAVALAKAVQYVTAGTVENVANPKREFFFLEMNTRLQVEHPITELITGVDLVEQMIRAAAGLRLSITQDAVKIHGHATEARVYAEDPTKNYFPSIGRLTQYVEPTGDGVRIDSGILEGSQISVYYDPLIAKLSTWGETRAQSLERMAVALDEYVVRGLRHNICLLRDVITEADYAAGNITTAYLPHKYPKGFQKAPITPEQRELLFATSAVVHAVRERALHSNAELRAKAIATTLVASLGARAREAETSFGIVEDAADRGLFTIAPAREGAAPMLLRVDWQLEQPVVRVSRIATDGSKKVLEVAVLQLWGTNDVTYDMQCRGTTFEVNVMTPLQARLAPFAPLPDKTVNAKQLLSPMPGVIVHINVTVGQTVVAGTEILTLEAMKMRNKLRAETDGKVKAINVKVGETVDDAQILVEFE